MDLALGVRLRLGVSSCLLGEGVRPNGAHKRDHWIADRIGPMVEWIAVCPEVEAGLGVPRERIQLEAAGGDGIAVRGLDSRRDYTEQILRWARARIDQLDLDNLDGYLLKSRSPSCGVEGVPVFEDEVEVGRARGRFAQALLDRDPALPICNEVDLQVPELRRHFLERTQARARWRALVSTLPDAPAPREAAVALFLARHELLLVCREQELPPLGDCACDLAALRAVGQEFGLRMAAVPTVSGHVRALAFLHDALDTVSTSERLGLALLVRDVEAGNLDVEVPRQLARGLLLRSGEAHLMAQHYVDPVPLRTLAASDSRP